MTMLELTGPLDPANPLPLYRQLEGALRRSIESQRLLPGEALPPERDVASQLGISRITVRKALDTLVSDGFLARRQGAGTFVSRRVEKEFFPAHFVHPGHDRTRPQAAQPMARQA